MADVDLDELLPSGPAPAGFETLRGADVQKIAELTRDWSPDRKAVMLQWLKAAAVRERVKTQYRHPAELATAVDPSYVVTPAIELISRSIERVLHERQRNLLVTMSPQEGKSNLCAVWTPIRGLQLDPNRRIILATYGDTLAEEHSTTCRNIIQQHGSGVTDSVTGATITDQIGLSLSTSRLASWRVAGGRGGLIAVGLGSSITGRPADLMIIDDPYKNMMEADSKAHRKKVSEWFRSVALTRLSPDASIIMIQTRWHPNDLAGEIMHEEAALPPEYRTWRHLNIPAVSEEGIPDALHREPGVPMVSARGRTKRDFELTRRKVGDRVWYALYQGVPASPEGGLFSRKWFDAWRLALEPAHPISRVVAIDPADSGEGDETGIIAASLTPDGVVAFTHDRSAQLTSDRWAREAVQLALEVGAGQIAVEGYTTAKTYVNVVKAAWKALHKESLERKIAGAQLAEWELRACSSSMPFIVHPWRGKGDAVARSSLLRQAFETGRARVVAQRLASFEDQAAVWQVGQHQPDRLAAGVIAHDRLSQLAGGAMEVSDPVTSAQRASAAPEWLRRKI